MGGASYFVLQGSVGQTEGHRGGEQKTRTGAGLSEVNPLPNTAVRPTQNIHFLFPPLSTIKLLTGFRVVPVHYIQQQW